MDVQPDRLMEEARTRTGLSGFGDDAFREPLERLCASVRLNDDLSSAGEFAFPELLIHALVNRLKVEDWFTRHPEIDEQVIDAPIFIVGLPRTGSTLLSYLLALDPGTRFIRQWESEEPCPPPIAGDESDPRIAESEARHDAFVEAMPALVPMVPYGGAGGPVECYESFYSTFDYAHFDMFVHCPDYTDWYMDPARDHSAAYRYHHRVLKLLQWRCPPRRWFLKMPSHSLMIENVVREYPDARFVMTHRDPAKVIPSVVHLNNTVRAVHLNDPKTRWFGKHVTGFWSEATRRLLAFRDNHESLFFDVYHGRQIADSLPQMEALYHWLGWPLAAAYVRDVAAWRADNPKGDNRFDMSTFGLDMDEIRDAFAFYTARFPEVVPLQSSPR